MAETKTILMARGEKTTLTKANNDSYSLRTTVPKGVANQLDLKDGDSIVWKLVPNCKEFMIIVEPSHEKNGKKK
jgi:hypothetical protein